MHKRFYCLFNLGNIEYFSICNQTFQIFLTNFVCFCVYVFVCVYVCVLYLYLICSEDWIFNCQSEDILQSEDMMEIKDILVGPHKFKVLFEC